MSLSTTIGAGALIGGVAAFAVYAAAAPGDQAPAAASVPATFAPVPTPTVTQTAEDCEPPAVLTQGECLITEPGPTVVVWDPAPAPRTMAEPGDDEGEDDDEQESGDDDHESEDRESDDHESDDHGDGDDGDDD